MQVEGQENVQLEGEANVHGTQTEAPGTREGEGSEETVPEDEHSTLEPAAYAPKHTFRVMDEEKEFEDWVKPLIKDPESEQRFRDLYERAHGIEHVKADRQALREENTNIKQEVTQYRNVLTQLSEMKQSGDWESYFEALQVPKEVILKQAQKLVELHQNPQAAAQYEQQRQQVWQSRQQQESHTALQQQLAEMRSQQVDMALNYGPHASFVKEFEQRVGRQGSFKEEVFKAGLYHYNTTGQDLPVQDAINQVLSLAGYQPNAQQQPMAYGQPQGNGMTYTPGQGQYTQPNAPGQASPTHQPVAQARPPVLPNISGTGGSPVKAMPRSIDDLRRRRAELG